MGQINQPSNLIDRLRRLERELAEVRKRAGLGNAQISSGNFTVTDGAIVVEDADGRDIVKVGKHVDGFGNPVTGIVVWRPDGTTSLWAYATEGGDGYASMWDRSGNICVSTDGASGAGLATPYLPYPMYPVANPGTTGDFTAMPGTTSTSFQSHWAAEIIVFHPRIRFMWAVNTTGLNTGEVRLLLNGTVLTTHSVTNTSPNQSYDETFSVPGWGTTVTPTAKATLSIQGRATTGGATTYTRPFGVYGVQS